jgi:hypothetical protein
MGMRSQFSSLVGSLAVGALHRILLAQHSAAQHSIVVSGDGARAPLPKSPRFASLHFPNCRLFESVVPLEDEVLRHLRSPLAPFCTTLGLRFGGGDVGEAGGPWRSFFVGVAGAVGAVEEEVLWPNQVRGALESVFACD